MEHSPLISVVVPTHNRPDFLKRTLESIGQQTYTNLQIIVISNGFNSDNKKIIDALQDSRIEYYEQENSGGPASPRNHGIRLAKGKYIAFCDDDDLWQEDKIQKQIEALEKHSDFGLCYSKMIRFDGEREWTVPHEEGPTSFRELLYINTIPISSVLMKKAQLDKFGGFCESKIVGTSEDYEFLLRHSLKTKFLFMNEYLIKYWSGANRTSSITRKENVKRILYYFFGVMGCFYCLGRLRNVSFYSLVKPLFFHIYQTLRVLIYYFLKNLRIYK